MRVFVTGTGRCGTTTFYQACRHITNYTSAHETEAGRIPSYQYPDRHIEVSHLLVVGIPFIRQHFPDSVWVHLTRSREACIQSIRGQLWGEVAAWSREWYLTDHPALVYEAAQAYYDRVIELCQVLLPDAITIPIERAREWFPYFWHKIGAEGDMDAALNEFDRAYNPSVSRGRDSFVEAPQTRPSDPLSDPLRRISEIASRPTWNAWHPDAQHLLREVLEEVSRAAVDRYLAAQQALKLQVQAQASGHTDVSKGDSCPARTDTD